MLAGRKIAIISLVVFAQQLSSQELFPTTEPASCLAKGTFGVSPIMEIYKEVSVFRYQGAMRLYYGITSRLEVYAEPVVNNHHSLFLPANFLTHTHVGNTTVFSAASIYGLKYPVLFGGIYGYAKFRLLSVDENDGHFRAALYGEYSSSKRAHDEAEPDLEGDNGGYGAGLILTRLKGRFAASFTGGFLVANSYTETVTYNYAPYFYGSYPFTNHITYGNDVIYNLSLGYLLSPVKYENYYQDNYNVYLELKGATYSAAQVAVGGVSATATSPSLKGGSYVEAWPGIQGIYNSNTRIDLSMGLELYSRSWNHFYPDYVVSWKHFFYLEKRKKVGDGGMKGPAVF